MKAKILVPYDFGPASVRALAWAVEQAKSVGGSIHVLHMVDLTPTAPMWGPIPVVLSHSDMIEIEDALRAEVASCGFTATSSVQAARSFGDAVLEAARDGAFDLIVMGTHGRGALGRFAFGSVADYVTRHAPMPVVTVRAPEAA